MDVKSNVKRRREERIKQLVSQEGGNSARSSLQLQQESSDTIPLNAVRDYTSRLEGREGQASASPPRNSEEYERDPELMWKLGQGRWKDPSPFREQDSPAFTGGKRSSFWRMFFIRLIISVLIFSSLWAINRYEPSWSGPVRLFVARSLTYEMDFGAAEDWYKRHFGGAPTFIPIFRQSAEKGVKVDNAINFSVPLDGRIAGSFALSLKGVNIVPAGDSSEGLQVKSVETGRVLSAGDDALTGKTVVIQHASGYVSIYGHLEQFFIEKGEWVENGELIGKLPAVADQGVPALYFALKKDEQYIDPADVIPFD